MAKEALISFIVPALNEEKYIENTLRSIPTNCQIIIVDGISEDKTREISKQYGKVIRCNGNRAKRMNKGAKIASGDILVFLHPDTILPKNSAKLIREIIKKNDAGAFNLEFDHKSFLMNLTGFFSNLRMTSLRMIWGDQTLFMKKDVFTKLGGFKDMELFEDTEISKRLRKIAKIGFVKDKVVTSSRRYLRRGIIKQNLINQILKILYVCGVSDKKLKNIYDKL